MIGVCDLRKTAHGRHFWYATRGLYMQQFNTYRVRQPSTTTHSPGPGRTVQVDRRSVLSAPSRPSRLEPLAAFRRQCPVPIPLSRTDVKTRDVGTLSHSTGVERWPSGIRRRHSLAAHSGSTCPTAIRAQRLRHGSGFTLVIAILTRSWLGRQNETPVGAACVDRRVPSEKTDVGLEWSSVKQLCRDDRQRCVRLSPQRRDGKYGNHSFLSAEREPCGVLARMRCDRVLYKAPASTVAAAARVHVAFAFKEPKTGVSPGDVELEDGKWARCVCGAGQSPRSPGMQHGVQCCWSRRAHGACNTHQTLWLATSTTWQQPGINVVSCGELSASLAGGAGTAFANSPWLDVAPVFRMRMPATAGRSCHAGAVAVVLLET